MQSIAIVFGDNDFDHTFRSLLTTLARAVGEHPEFTREQVSTLIHEGSRFHYIAFQHRFQYESDFDTIERYLREPLKILFDADADAAYQSEDHNHSAWHLHIESGQINSF